MATGIIEGRQFIDTYSDILTKGPNFVKPDSDYEKRVKMEITKKTDDVWDFFNEDERLFNKRSVVGPPT